MIHYVTDRFESDGRRCMPEGKGPMAERDQTVADSVVSLVKYELGFGGHPTEVTDTMVTTRTNVFGRYDVTTFTGTKEEMRPLVLACFFWATLNKDKKRMIDFRMDLWEKVMGDQAGVPLLICNFEPIVSGQAIAKQICLFLIGQNNEEWAEWVVKNIPLIPSDENEFYDIVKLIIGGDQDFATPEQATAFLREMQA